MKTVLDCIPCLVRQAIEAMQYVTLEEKKREEILKELLRYMSDSDLMQSPPVIARGMHRILRKLTGVDDPYQSLKEKFNDLALSMLESFHNEIESSPDPLLTAIKLSIAGNVIDCGAKSGLTEEHIDSSIKNSLHEKLHGDLEKFIEGTKNTKNILFISDNAGEIVFDRLLIEHLGPHRITLAVRGFPVINDATINDARAVGLDRIVPVIENGSDAPGTIFNECSEEFKKTFNEADLIIAKGQGNYESLCTMEKEIFFLLKIKCPIIANHTGYPVGAHTIIDSVSHSTKRGN